MRYRLHEEKPGKFIVLLQIQGKKHLFVGVVGTMSHEDCLAAGSQREYGFEEMTNMVQVSFDEVRPNLFGVLMPLLQHLENERIEKDRKDNAIYIRVPRYLKGSEETGPVPTTRSLRALDLDYGYPEGGWYVISVDKRKLDTIKQRLGEYGISVIVQ